MRGYSGPAAPSRARTPCATVSARLDNERSRVAYPVFQSIVVVIKKSNTATAGKRVFFLNNGLPYLNFRTAT
jgi:hypothetical protein